MPGHDQDQERMQQAAGAGSNLSRTPGSDDDNMDPPGTAGGFDPGTGGGADGTDLSGAGGQGGMGSGQGGMGYGQAGAGSAADQATTGSTATDDDAGTPMPDRPEEGGSSQWSEGSEGEAR